MCIRDRWEIVPVGEYELVGLEYVRTTVDSFEPTEVICDHDEYTNEHLSVCLLYTSRCV